MRHILLIIAGFTAVLAYIWLMMSLLLQYECLSLILEAALCILE